MKNIPNLITATRIVLSALLLLVKPFSLVFYFMYIACGLTDIIDGYLARKFSFQSKLGATLDSIADFVFVVVMLIVLLPKITFPKAVLIWIAVIAVLRFISLAIGYIKYKKLAFLHTYLNKFTGLILFIAVLFLQIADGAVVMRLCCMVASISALEEIIINIKSKELDRDSKSVIKTEK